MKIKQALLTIGAVLGIFLSSYGLASATSAFLTVQGGTGTTSPSGILYGDNGATSHLNTVTVGTGLSFTGGTLSSTGSGSGNVATSTHETANNLPLWTSTSGSPATLGQILAGTNGFVLAEVGGVPTWVATSSIQNLTLPLSIANGGTATSTYYTGGINYFDGTELSQAAGIAGSSLFYDAANGRLGVGTSTPQATLDLYSNNADTTSIQSIKDGASGAWRQIVFRTNAFGPQYVANHARGTYASPAVLSAAGDDFLSISGRGWDGSSTAIPAGFVSGTDETFETAEAWDTTHHGSQITFSTNALGAAANPVERVRFTANGQVGIGTTTPFGLLESATSSTATTFKGQLVLTDNSGGVGLKHFQFAEEGGNLYISSTTDTYGTTTTPNLTLTNAGRIGIATSTPYAQFSVGGNVVIGASLAGGTLGDLFLPKLGTAAGSFIAVDATGKVIATTTSSGGSGTVTSIATNNGLTGGTITTTGTIGLATINAGVLGAVTNGSVPTSQATSTLYGVGTNGTVLAEVAGIPTWTATSTLANISGTLNLASQVTGILPIANGGTATSTGGVTNGGEYYNGSTLTNDAAFIHLPGAATGFGTTTPFSQLSISTSTASSPFTSLFAVASSTNATLLNVLGSGNVGIGTTTPGSLLSLGGIANFTTGTSTFYGNGLNLTSGCYAIGSTCIQNTISNATAYKQAVTYATTGALPANTYLSGVLTEVGSGALSVDGASPAIGNRILVKNEATQTNNGIYTVTATGSGIAAYVLTRATDYNTSSDIYPGVASYTLLGTANGDTTWVLTTPAPVTLDSSNLTYAESANGNITLPLSVANGGTGKQTFSVSQVLYGSGTNAVSSVATTSPTLSSGFSYTGTIGALVGGASGTLSQIEHRSFTYATSTAWTGTTTIPIEVGYGEVFNSLQCFTDAGTLGVDFYHSTNHLNYIPTASTTANTFNFTTNNTITASDKMSVDLGTPASSPTRITCTIKDTY